MTNRVTSAVTNAATNADVHGHWWQRAVVYQIYPRSFADANGDGIGDLPGVIEHLDHLAELGVDTFWLSPFYPSPMADFGYDVADYCDVDPRFGTLADFDRLVKEAHDRSMRVIIDFVPNHTSSEHPWFVESRSSRTNPKRGWYVWRDSAADGSPPNNWIAHFGGRMWTFDDATGQWYLHSFLPEQPDLDWRNPEVRAAMFDVIRFWIRRGVDGFRVDVAGAIAKDPELRDNPPNPLGSQSHKALGEYDTQLHLNDHLHPDIHDLYRELRRLLDEWPDGGDRVIIGELHLYDMAEWAKFFGQGDEIHLPFNFGLLKVPWDGSAISGHVEAVEAESGPRAGWPTYVLGNHDETRPATRLGARQARVGMMLLLTLRGTPTIYYADELGHPDLTIPPELEQDPWGLRVPGLNLSRDPARTPMPWDEGANAGFTDPGAVPWLPVASSEQCPSVAAQNANATSMLELTRRLLHVRRTSEALTIGDYQTLRAELAWLAYERRHGDERVVVVLNLTSEPRQVDLNAEDGRVLVSTHLDRRGTVSLRSLDLRSDEGIVIRVGG